jgi:hypothetical protein
VHQDILQHLPSRSIIFFPTRLMLLNHPFVAILPWDGASLLHRPIILALHPFELQSATAPNMLFLLSLVDLPPVTNISETTILFLNLPSNLKFHHHPNPPLLHPMVFLSPDQRRARSVARSALALILCMIKLKTSVHSPSRGSAISPKYIRDSWRRSL